MNTSPNQPTEALPLLAPAAIADQIADRHREIVVCSVSSRRAIPATGQLSRLGWKPHLTSTQAVDRAVEEIVAEMSAA